MYAYSDKIDEFPHVCTCTNVQYERGRDGERDREGEGRERDREGERGGRGSER